MQNNIPCSHSLSSFTAIVECFFAQTLYERTWQQSCLPEVFNKHTSRRSITREKLAIASISNWESHFPQTRKRISTASKYFKMASFSRQMSLRVETTSEMTNTINNVLYFTTTTKLGATSTSCDLEWRHCSRHRSRRRHLLLSSSIHQSQNSGRDCVKVARRIKIYFKMSLYPSLEDMKVDQMAQAQVLRFWGLMILLLSNFKLERTGMNLMR